MGPTTHPPPTYELHSQSLHTAGYGRFLRKLRKTKKTSDKLRNPKKGSPLTNPTPLTISTESQFLLFRCPSVTKNTDDDISETKRATGLDTYEVRTTKPTISTQWGKMDLYEKFEGVHYYSQKKFPLHS